MTTSPTIPRRAFLAGLGFAAGGLALGISQGVVHAAPEADPAIPAPGTTGFRANAWVHVAPDGVVTIVCHRSEMGQGVRSSLHIVIADELGADLARVKLVQGTGDKAYGDQNTDGSHSVRGHFDELRMLGATARTMLIEVAARQWGVTPAECTAKDHAVRHTRTKRTLDFGALATGAAKLKVPDAAKVKLRPKSELVHVGTDLPNLDAPDITTGKAIYGADIRLEGMLTAVIARPPVVGGKVFRFDGSRALAVAGVRKLVEMPALTGAPKFQPLGGVAVLADHTWAALVGRRALSIEWEHGANASYDSARYKDELLAAVKKPGKVVRSVGDVDRALATAAKRVEAEYYVPHLAHVPMEPPAAVARFKDGACECWAPTQHPQAARTEVAQALKIDEAKVTIHVTLLGGAFGRKSKPDFIVEAALLSKAAGVPVRVQWTREDDIQHDYFHAVSAQSLKAGLDASGKIVAWHHRTAFPPIPSTFSLDVKWPSDGELGQGPTDIPLDIPNIRVEGCEAPAHVRIGWMRSVCNIFHAFALSSFIDEIAHAKGKDPKETLLEVLGPPRLLSPKEAGVEKFSNYGAPIEESPIDVGRHRKVIERVTELSGWQNRKSKDGRVLGLAAHRSFLSSVGVVAAVSKGKTGVVVDEVWIVIDAGTIVNRERVRSQMEGAVVFGMSIAFHGAITMRNGAVEQTNFRDYPVARIGEVPQRIHVDIIASDASPGGVGEPGVPPVAPAIANAVFALTGTRIRELPIRI
ncbi:MAG: acylaldehyde oxidase [Myxococcaceae bacterium]|nr:acylaldehyde oxidase [Myxococcaceae bacterium]